MQRAMAERASSSWTGVSGEVQEGANLSEWMQNGGSEGELWKRAQAGWATGATGENGRVVKGS